MMELKAELLHLDMFAEPTLQNLPQSWGKIFLINFSTQGIKSLLHM